MSGIKTEAAQLLLDNEFICEYSHPESFGHLSDQFKREDMDQWLSLIERKVCYTHDHKVFYLGFSDISDPDNIKLVRKEFDMVINSLEPIVRWIELTSNYAGTGAPVTAGDVISESILMSNIEQSPAQLNKLKLIARTSFIGSKTDDTRAMIKLTMQRFKEHGYFTALGGSGTQYRATGKWSWLYVVLDFIATNEGLAEQGETVIQEGLI